MTHVVVIEIPSAQRQVMGPSINISKIHCPLSILFRSFRFNLSVQVSLFVFFRYMHVFVSLLAGLLSDQGSVQPGCRSLIDYLVGSSLVFGIQLNKN